MDTDVEKYPHRHRDKMMKTIQITLDETLLQRVDQATRSQNIARSQFIRQALELALRQRTIQNLEEKQLEGYRRKPVMPGEFDVWKNEQAWE